MTIELLDGKVRVSDLRDVASERTSRAPNGRPPFWSTDSRGVASVFLRQPLSMQTAEYVASATGSVRGNHVHWKAVEHLFIASGEARLYVEDVKAGLREDIWLGSGTLVVIQPGVAHAILSITESTMIAIAEGADSLLDREQLAILPTSEHGFLLEQSSQQ